MVHALRSLMAFTAGDICCVGICLEGTCGTLTACVPLGQACLPAATCCDNGFCSDGTCLPT
jgi:hypothetical protein